MLKKQIHPRLTLVGSMRLGGRGNAGAMGIAGVLLMLLVSVASGSAGAAGLPNPLANSSAPWHINADKMTYDRDTGLTTAIGNAVLQKKGFHLSADRIEYSRSRNTGVAMGHVRVTAGGGDRMSGQRMQLDLSNGTGTLYNGTLFLKKNHYIIKGKKIQKTSDRGYAADGVQVTTCDGKTPDWAITGKRLDVTLGGYGFMRGAAFKVKGIPLLYTPFFVFPAKVKRQSGFLTPEFGNSTRKGFEFTLPFYWAINAQSDATFYEHYMSLRGNMLGGEFRWVQSDGSRGTIMLDGFNDRQVDDGKDDNTARFGYAGDGALRPNSDRYWFRMKQNQMLPAGVTAQLDLDVVSDQDYLHEFKSGYNGFEASDTYFKTYFGRDLDDYTDPVRTNRLNFNKIWSSASLNAEFRWLDDVIARRQGTTDETVQRLPRITLDSARRNLFGTPLQLGVDSEYDYFFRKDGARGHRMDLHPHFYIPFRFGPYLSVEPSVGLEETIWQLDRNDGLPDNASRTLHREYYDAQLELASEQYRVYSLHTSWADALKHISRFQVDYDFVPKTDQSEYPTFDALDRIASQNLIRYAWIHTLISRSVVKDGHGATGSAQSVRHRYRELARLEFEQEYDIDKARAHLPEPFSPLSTQLEVTLSPQIYLKADVGWSTYSNKLVSNSLSCYLSDERGDRVHIEQRYIQGSESSLYLEMLAPLTPWLWLNGNFERNFHTGENLNRGVGLTYRSHCWSFQIGYGKEENDESLTFAFTLYGLGNFGSGSQTAQLMAFPPAPGSDG